MKFIISAVDGTKRQFEGPWQICASRTDLMSLVDCLNAALCEERFAYGWVNVVELPKSGPANTQPIGWREDAF